MRVLITYGGTQVPIDDVRYIGNFSKGTTGAAFAKTLINLGFEVHILKAKDAWSVLEYSSNLVSINTFVTYEEYFHGLKELLQKNEFDVVLLAAAVSDFASVKITGKMHGEEDNTQTLFLKPLPKVIKKVKEWSKNPNIVQVGFKLLAGCSYKELIETAQKAQKDNNSDFIIANRLEDIKSGQHRLFLVEGNNVQIFRKELEEGSHSLPALISNIMLKVHNKRK